MSDFWSGVLGNIIANLVFWLVGGFLVWLTLNIGYRRNIRRFFGMQASTEYIVYLSSYEIERGTIRDRNGVIRGHEGKAIPEYEFQTIPVLSSILSPNSIRNVPDLFKGLIDGLWARSMPPIRFEPSPLQSSDPPPSSSLCVGGPKFNAVTQYYLDTRRGFFNHFKDDTLGRWRIQISHGSKTGYIVCKDLPKDEVDVGYIQRFTDTETKATIILLAGLGVNGTRAAAHYLATNWQVLYKEFGVRDFAIAFSCPDVKKNPNGYLQLTLVQKLS